MRGLPWLLLGLGLGLSLSVQAEPLSLLTPALTGGHTSLQLRPRWEQVDDDGGKARADAFTTRLRLGYTTSKWNRLDAGVEASHTFALDAEEYDSSRNGRSRYALVRDPRGGTLSQAWLGWQAPYAFTFRLGRQALDFDQQRYIGSDDFRQRSQRFEAVTVSNDYLPETRVDASWITAAHGVDGRRRGLQGHVLRARNTQYPLANVLAYGYWLDFDRNTPEQRATRTLGLRLSGAATRAGLTLSYALEGAQQGHMASTPAGINARYALAEAGVGHAGFGLLQQPQLTLGLEVLGGDGRYGFATPLASLHDFQGAASVFTQTPADGLRDFYARLDGRVASARLSASWHGFYADERDRHYGEEWDARIEQPLGKKLQLGGQYAYYDAHGFGSDTQKIWLWLQADL